MFLFSTFFPFDIFPFCLFPSIPLQFRVKNDISFRKVFDLQFEPFESNNLLVESDRVTVPWIPLTPTLLLPYHIDFERIPLTFCPRNKRCFDIEMTIPAYRKRRNNVVQEEKKNQDKKKRKRMKKKTAQRRKKKNIE